MSITECIIVLLIFVILYEFFYNSYDNDEQIDGPTNKSFVALMFTFVVMMFVFIFIGLIKYK